MDPTAEFLHESWSLDSSCARGLLSPPVWASLSSLSARLAILRTSPRLEPLCDALDGMLAGVADRATFTEDLLGYADILRAAVLAAEDGTARNPPPRRRKGFMTPVLACFAKGSAAGQAKKRDDEQEGQSQAGAAQADGYWRRGGSGKWYFVKKDMAWAKSPEAKPVRGKKGGEVSGPSEKKPPSPRGVAGARGVLERAKQYLAGTKQGLLSGAARTVGKMLKGKGSLNFGNAARQLARAVGVDVRAIKGMPFGDVRKMMIAAVASGVVRKPPPEKKPPPPKGAYPAKAKSPYQARQQQERERPSEASQLARQTADSMRSLLADGGEHGIAGAAGMGNIVAGMGNREALHVWREVVPPSLQKKEPPPQTAKEAGERIADLVKRHPGDFGDHARVPDVSSRIAAEVSLDRHVGAVLSTAREWAKASIEREAGVAKGVELAGTLTNFSPTGHEAESLRRHIRENTERLGKVIVRGRETGAIGREAIIRSLRSTGHDSKLSVMSVAPGVHVTDRKTIDEAVTFVSKALRDQGLTLHFGTPKPGQKSSTATLGKGGDTMIRIHPGEPAHVVVHEIGHAIEYHVPGVRELVHTFLKHRTGGSDPEPLDKLGKPGAVGKSDDFGKVFGKDAAYVGRAYPSGHTEVVSMGLQMLYADPVRFAKHDPEYFKLMSGILDGTLLKKARQ